MFFNVKSRIFFVAYSLEGMEKTTSADIYGVEGGKTGKTPCLATHLSEGMELFTKEGRGIANDR